MSEEVHGNSDCNISSHPPIIIKVYTHTHTLSLLSVLSLPLSLYTVHLPICRAIVRLWWCGGRYGGIESGLGILSSMRGIQTICDSEIAERWEGDQNSFKLEAGRQEGRKGRGGKNGSVIDIAHPYSHKYSHTHTNTNTNTVHMHTHTAVSWR